MTIFYATVAKRIVGHFQTEDAAKEASERYCDRHNLPARSILITPHRVFRTATQHEREHLAALRHDLISRLTEDERAALGL